jgi:Kef-type K+ transport system membrane component KefB
MDEQILIFRDVAMVFAGAFIVGILFHRLRQPLIIGYALAGHAAPAPGGHTSS